MFDSQMTLIGIVPKTGSGEIEGRKWSHDHVECHVLASLSSEKGAVGQGGQILKLQDCGKWFEVLKSMVGTEVIISFDLITDGKGNNTLTPKNIKPKK